MGTSLGGLDTWVCGSRYPDFMDGLLPFGGLATQISSLNRAWRRVVLDAIRHDPEWKNGEYAEPPLRGMRAAMGNLFIMTSAPLVQHRQASTRVQADSFILAYIDRQSRALDANDVIYAFEASRDYDPSPHLARITVPVLAINSADDFVNPPELGLMEKLLPRVRHGRYVLIPTSDQTRGHGTHSQPAIWREHLATFLQSLPPATAGRSLLLDPSSPEWEKPAPPRSHLLFETTKGAFVLELMREWGPRGADRVYNLARLGYYNDTRVHRMRAGYIAQFGLNGDPAVNAIRAAVHP
jgi:homoserine O-acetyltransferase